MPPPTKGRALLTTLGPTRAPDWAWRIASWKLLLAGMAQVESNFIHPASGDRW
jgi:hypothetical protein